MWTWASTRVHVDRMGGARSNFHAPRSDRVRPLPGGPRCWRPSPLPPSRSTSAAASFFRSRGESPWSWSCSRSLATRRTLTMREGSSPSPCSSWARSVRFCPRPSTRWSTRRLEGWRSSWFPSAPTRTASGRECATKQPSTEGLPGHQVVRSPVLDRLEPEPQIEAHGRIELLDVDRQRLAGSLRLRHQVAQQGGADPFPSELRHQGDVDQADLRPPPVHVEPSRRHLIDQDQVELRVGVVLLVPGVLGLELHPDEPLLLLVGPVRDHGQLIRPGSGVETEEEFHVLLPDRPQGNRAHSAGSGSMESRTETKLAGV